MSKSHHISANDKKRKHIGVLALLAVLLLAILVILIPRWTPSGQLIVAIRHNNIARVKSILDKYPALANHRYPGGTTPFHYVAMSKNSGKLANILISYGSRVNDVDDQGGTPLMCAIVPDNKAVVAISLRNHASTDIWNNSGAAPLHIAAWNGRNDIVKMLISAGANVNIVDKTRREFTPLHYAARFNKADTADILIKHGAKLNAKSNEGTPLHVAIQYDSDDVVKLLKKYHARAN